MIRQSRIEHINSLAIGLTTDFRLNVVHFAFQRKDHFIICNFDQDMTEIEMRELRLLLTHSPG